MNIENVIVGNAYLWLMPTHPETKRRFRYLQDVYVSVVGKSDTRVQVRFTFGCQVYDRWITTANLLEIQA